MPYLFVFGMLKYGTGWQPKIADHQLDDSLVGQLTSQALPIVFVPGNAMLEQNTIATSYFSPEHLSQSSAAMVGHC